MNFDLKGLRRLEQAFDKARQEITTTTGGLRKRLERGMGGLDAGQNVQVFKRETDPSTGKRWARLSPAYAKRKRQISNSRKVLVLRGDLKRSLTRRTPGGERVIRMTGMTMHLGTTRKTGAYHMKGRSNMPARPMVGKTRNQLRAQGAEARKHLQAAVGRALGGPAGRKLMQEAARIKPDPRRW